MIRGFIGVALVTTVVALIAAASVIGMVLLIDVTDGLTRTVTNADSTYLADLTDACDAFQTGTCEYSLN